MRFVLPGHTQGDLITIAQTEPAIRFLVRHRPCRMCLALYNGAVRVEVGCAGTILAALNAPWIGPLATVLVWRGPMAGDLALPNPAAGRNFHRRRQGCYPLDPDFCPVRRNARCRYFGCRAHQSERYFSQRRQHDPYRSRRLGPYLWRRQVPKGPAPLAAPRRNGFHGCDASVIQISDLHSRP